LSWTGLFEGSTGNVLPDPPRGRPVGGGGTHRSWGCGGDSPRLGIPFSYSATFGFSRFSEFFQKSLTQQPELSKKVRLASWQFQKKIASAIEDYKKTSGPLLRIPEKERLGC